VPVYPAGCITRRVLSSGEITLNGDRVVIGRALAGQLVGLRYESGLRWRAWFFESDLGTIEIAGHDLIDTELVQSADVVPAATVAIPVNPNEGHQTVTPVSARSPENVSAMS
jgi:hypothetical protein